MKKLMIFIVILMAILGFLAYITSGSKCIKKSSSIKPSQAALQAFYNNCLVQEEKRLWHDIEQNYGITHAQCKRLANEFVLDPRETKPIPVSQPMLNLIGDVLNDFKLPKVNVVGFDNPDSPAETDKDNIYVNEVLLALHSNYGTKFIIGHELRHQLHLDPRVGFALEQLLSEKGVKTTFSCNDPVRKMFRFFEMRADIETAIRSPEYAQGLIDANEQFRKEFGYDGRGITHPKFSIRLKAGKTILAAHQKVNSDSVQVS